MQRRTFFFFEIKRHFFDKFFSENVALFLIRVFSNRNFSDIILEVSEYYFYFLYN